MKFTRWQTAFIWTGGLIVMLAGWRQAARNAAAEDAIATLRQQVTYLERQTDRVAYWTPPRDPPKRWEVERLQECVGDLQRRVADLEVDP